MHISLRAGEKIYINGAVLCADRKVSLELLNDATFLLEAHVMKVENATTPLRQLYFIVQIMLMNPTDSAVARAMFEQSMRSLVEIADDQALLAGLRAVRGHVEDGRVFEGLRSIRSLFSIEAGIMSGDSAASPTQAA
ncbi:flagellar FlbT family protein [Methylocella silvestris BL2]|uniref:Flagellar FlbT family protein n=1 Tax=Methylocella silvestris (strain DSM 15510 / CIP 108128 / LMG 27833 / NCIMB 13906 / BL2) TaxID=395965 RepID=B8EL34_METSB|nr:flagellar biosynthesis repressor FlbT [Methylocella silvestris]ACK49029.1 flagellar FlbT family protein [Methylocella silvestris BL2]